MCHKAALKAVARKRTKVVCAITVSTTSVRSLEIAWDAAMGALRPREREATSLYIAPRYEFLVVDALITNFHAPRSTLMMPMSAFATRDSIMVSYSHAIAQRYRLLSFSDTMFIR